MSSKNNVVLLTFDSVRADHCGHHGYARATTPNMDKLANDGIMFEQAVAPAARTNPSMSCIMTGKTMLHRGPVADPSHSRRHLNRYKTVAERFADQGYTTAAFCPNAYASRYYGFDKGFDHFEDFLFSSDHYQSLFNRHLSDSGIYTTLRNLRNFIRKEEAFRSWDTYIDDIVSWVEDQRDPFFLWIFSLDTHFPYITPRGHRQWSSAFDTYYYNFKLNSLINEFDVRLSERERRKIADIYDDALRYGDKLIGELHDRLSHRNPTYLIHADHGEALGEHMFYGHYFPSLYNECVHVPLIAWSADITSGTIKEPFTLANVPDLLSAAGQGALSPDSIPRENFVATSTYDGRRDRNLVSVNVGHLKAIAERTTEETTIEVYDNEDGCTEQNKLPEEHEVTLLLRNFISQRYNHEDEQLAVRTAVADLVENL